MTKTIDNRSKTVKEIDRIVGSFKGNIIPKKWKNHITTEKTKRADYNSIYMLSFIIDVYKSVKKLDEQKEEEILNNKFSYDKNYYLTTRKLLMKELNLSEHAVVKSLKNLNRLELIDIKYQDIKTGYNEIKVKNCYVIIPNASKIKELS